MITRPTCLSTRCIGDHFEIQGGTTEKYIFAGNLRVAQVKGSTRTYFHKDHLGSSTVMTNNDGVEIETTEYMPFGGQRYHNGAPVSNYKFTDQELDAENGLYNYNARLYDPIIGRFISPDTIVQAPYNPQSLNRYSYCLNNPLNYTDPSGHEEDDELLASYMDFLWQFEQSQQQLMGRYPSLAGGFMMNPVPTLVDFWNSGFGDLAAWLFVKPLYYAGDGGGGGGSGHGGGDTSASITNTESNIWAGFGKDQWTDLTGKNLKGSTNAKYHYLTQVHDNKNNT